MVAAMAVLLSFSSSHSPPLPRIRFSATPKSLTMASMTMSEDPIREWILSEGKATQITATHSVGGGCINRAYRYETDVSSFFVKTNRSIGPSMFEGEVLGLSAMYETRTIRVPKPFKFGPLPFGGSYIIMEYIKLGSSWGNEAALGRKLAEMHKAGRSTMGFVIVIVSVVLGDAEAGWVFTSCITTPISIIHHYLNLNLLLSKFHSFSLVFFVVSCLSLNKLLITNICHPSQLLFF